MGDFELCISEQRNLQQALGVVQEFMHTVELYFETDKYALVYLVSREGDVRKNEQDKQLIDEIIWMLQCSATPSQATQ